MLADFAAAISPAGDWSTEPLGPDPFERALHDTEPDMAPVGQHSCEPPKILSDGGSNEFVLGPWWGAQPHQENARLLIV
jgi:hypothetical protein